ncbi:GNAT family N-acetyltransferase [Candidatus Amarobacter glycogenicus]|uniref:GNAT family N-acetyltransferase n=1 Tax=Candidatus Amarobacter glycogenicus TaxID=3140699 RepID=UPI0031373D2B|nr:GNAT family N-acetyltransferase [Dehalococcoidia bacterium]
MTRLPGPFHIVPYDRSRHADGPWRVVSAVFEEYGFPFAENDYDADVARPDEHYDGRTGWFSVAEDTEGGVVGCVGLTDEGGGEYELHRLYVLSEARGHNLGERLCTWVIEAAREKGAERVVLFSDVHFAHAHRLYERVGFRANRFRYAPDPWRSREWGFIMEFPKDGTN